MLNSKQVDQLFQQNAVLFENVDGVPKYRVVELFGEAAMDFAVSLRDNRGNHSEYGVRDYSTPYLTYKGFRVAATYANVREVETRESAKTKAKELGLTVTGMRVKA